jgi:hypothetical protein
MRLMAYSTAEARQQLLDALGKATDEIGLALACLTEAYEQLDEDTGDRLEEALFRPVQSAYGRARRTHSEFATRVELPVRTFAPPAQTHPRGTREAVSDAIEAVEEADIQLSELQDSLAPVEVGDAELRAGLSEVRRLLADVEAAATAFVRVLGR